MFIPISHCNFPVQIFFNPYAPFSPSRLRSLPGAPGRKVALEQFAQQQIDMISLNLDIPP